MIALDNQTGGILALVGGRDFEHNEYDRALQARRPPGTAITPFVYAAAFAKGSYPGTIVEDSALDNRTVMIGGTTGILGEWGPESADNRYEGPITAREALAKSKNGSAVRIGTNRRARQRHRSSSRPPAWRRNCARIPRLFSGAARSRWPSWRSPTPFSLTKAGAPAPPHILDRIEDKQGNVVWQAGARSRTRRR